MKLILANPRGFCAGVYMAIDVVEQLVDMDLGRPIYVHHEIVHNKHVVERFRHRGVRFVDDLDGVPEGSVVVFSAHGVSPALRRQAVDRQLEAVRYASKGFQILLVGHADHQEIVGTRGEAPDSIQVVSSPRDIPSLEIKDPNKLVYLTQTTLSMDDASRIVDALREAFPNIKDPPSEDICYATTNRQKAVQAIASSCDLVLVVGSKNSSNSVRLTEIAEARGAPSYLIDDTSELEEHWFGGVERVLITAGASAPEDLVRDLVLHLIDRYGGEVEQHDIFHESIEFGLPATLKRFMRQNGIDPNGRRIVRDDAEALDNWLRDQGIDHRTVEVTVGAT
jgi:4-hydroxy-3-methylbut-2-enyl diphosphate reductase